MTRNLLSIYNSVSATSLPYLPFCIGLKGIDSLTVLSRSAGPVLWAYRRARSTDPKTRSTVLSHSYDDLLASPERPKIAYVSPHDPTIHTYTHMQHVGDLSQSYLPQPLSHIHGHHQALSVSRKWAQSSSSSSSSSRSLLSRLKSSI